MGRRPQLRIVAPDATPEETAAVSAAVERFIRDTEPPPPESPRPTIGPWRRAALLEGVQRQQLDVPGWL